MNNLTNIQEKSVPVVRKGIPVLLATLIAHVLSVLLFFFFGSLSVTKGSFFMVLAIFCGIAFIALFFVYAGLKSVKPAEAVVLTLFGDYYGTLRGPGFFHVHPFCTSFNPASRTHLGQSGDVKQSKKTTAEGEESVEVVENKKISLKLMTLNNAKQKINDRLGNPVEIGIAVIWRVVDTAQAVFAVDNYKQFLSLQTDSALRNVVRIYPYDVTPDIDTTGDGIADEGSLRGSSETVARRIKDEIQEKVNIAGLEIVDARITHLSYAPEIASAMLRRQQASAVIDARSMIVDGAVSMVEMALNQLEEKHIVDLDDERKAAMVSNLLVVLCANEDPQPVVNSGSIY